MRIAFVTAEYVTERNYDGGLANYIHRTALALRQLGHKPIVVIASDKNGCFEHMGIEVHRVFPIPNPIVFIVDLLTLRIFRTFFRLVTVARALNKRVSRINRQERLSIIQFSHLGGFALFKTADVPDVVRISSYTPLCRIMGGCDSGYFQTLQQEFLEKMALKKSNRIFGPSKVINAIVAKEFDKHVELIESPFILDVDKTDISFYERNLAGKKYLLFFGSLSVLKGLATIAGCIHELLRRHPALYFAFVGKEMGGYEGRPMMEHIRNQAAEHSDRVLFLGQLRHEQLYPVIDRAAAVVLPSRIDNFPNTCLEAMALKKVVIGTYGTSFEQLIEDGQNGFLCNVDDSVDLLAAIEKALGLDQKETRRIGERAKKIIDRLAPDRIVQQLITYYSYFMNAGGN